MKNLDMCQNQNLIKTNRSIVDLPNLVTGEGFKYENGTEGTPIT